MTGVAEAFDLAGAGSLTRQLDRGRSMIGLLSPSMGLEYGLTGNGQLACIQSIQPLILGSDPPAMMQVIVRPVGRCMLIMHICLRV